MKLSRILKLKKLRKITRYRDEILNEENLGRQITLLSRFNNGKHKVIYSMRFPSGNIYIDLNTGYKYEDTEVEYIAKELWKLYWKEIVK